METEIIHAALIFITLLLAALLVYWLGRKRWRLWRIIQSGDPERVEAARSWVTPRLVPYLTKKYWREKDWSKKKAIVELLQDQSHPDLPKLMLDFLRVPLAQGDEQTGLSQAVALGFIDEKYDRFMDYYNDRDLLARDVRAVLGANGLQAEPPPVKQTTPPARPTVSKPKAVSPNERIINGVAADDLSMVQQALSEKANINTYIKGGTYNGCSTLLLAIALGHFDIAKFLIEQDADIHFTRSDLQGTFHTGRGQTALWWAATQGHLPLAKELIVRGANVNAPDHYGGTPLTTAASAGQLEMVRYLVSQGADIHAKLTMPTSYGRDGRNALHLAADKGHTAVVEYLLEAGNDPNEYCGSGYTPLMIAAQSNFYDMTELLIQRGADVNAVHAGMGNYIGMRGWTPLVFAIHAGLLRLSKLLIQAGANIHYRVPAGKRWDGKLLPERGMFDFAKGKRSDNLIKLLREQGLS